MNTQSKAQTTLLVIDNHKASIYKNLQPNSEPEKVHQDDTAGYKSHVQNAHDFEDRSDAPDNKAYFREVAGHLKGAEQVLIFGSGTGSSSAPQMFITWATEHEKELAAKIIDNVKIDQGHITEGEILAKARELLAP